MKITFLVPMLLPMWGIASAQLPNAKTETVRIEGNCDQCKQTIETAGTKKGEATLSWDADTHLAELTYDAAATTAEAVLKRVAYAGYDNERYLAPAEAYAALANCCQYERAPQATALTADGQGTTHGGHQPVATSQQSPIDGVLHAYFKLKDALVAGDAKSVTAPAIALAKQLGELSAPAAKQAATHAAAVAKAKTLDDQRNRFVLLSEHLYSLTKANTPSSAVYYQHCPMYNKGKGANWLSQEKAIRNPYYGEQMLTCGSVVETLGGNGAEPHSHN